MDTTANLVSFFGLGIAPRLLDILTKLRFTNPTPIQRQAIPPGIEGKDVIGIAQTGTGKTLAFGIPMIQRIATLGGCGLVILPTRELALQVEETLAQIGKPIGLRTAVLIGGESIGRQRMRLDRKPHVIIATPGRLIDHVMQKTLTLSNITILVLDEADRMFDMGFAPQIKQIFQFVPPAEKRQTMLFSATMPDAIASIATKHMKLPIRVEVAPAGTAAERVEQEIFIVRKDTKMDLLIEILEKYSGSVLIFSRTKHGANKMARILRTKGYSVNEIHSNKSLSQRKHALEGFKVGKYRILVATDIAARGIDVKNIELVINYDLPDNSEDYVHRIGRTGRAGEAGRAISFATPDQQYNIRTIEKLIRKALPVTRHQGAPSVRMQQEPQRPPAFRRKKRPFSQRRF